MSFSSNQQTTLLNTSQAAEYLGTSPATLTTWRCTRATRIPFVKIGRSVRYRRRDLDRFIDQQTVDSSVCESGGEE
jgi:excisionase family DNA binding protein